MLDFTSCSMTAGNIPVLITFTFLQTITWKQKDNTATSIQKQQIPYFERSPPWHTILTWFLTYHLEVCIYIYIYCIYIYIYTYCIYIYVCVCVFVCSDILSGIIQYSDILSGMLSGIYSDILSGILSGIYSDILSGIYSGILSGMCSGLGVAHSIRSRYGFQVQAWPTASGARDMEFGSRSGPLRPERATEMKKKVHKIAE